MTARILTEAASISELKANIIENPHVQSAKLSGAKELYKIKLR